MAGLTTLERVALCAILAESAWLEGELDRLVNAEVLKRENLGGGFFTTLAVPHPRPGESLHLGENVYMRVDGLEAGLGMILHLYDGRMPLLEGYAVGIEDTSQIDFERVGFALADGPPGPSPTGRS